MCISLTSTGSGHTIALINPPLSLTRGYKVGFAVSDSSLTQVISGKKTKYLILNYSEILILQTHILIMKKMMDSKS